MYLPLILLAIVAFSLGSMVYVYSSRGNARYTSISEYLRKGWPIFTPLNCLLYLFTEKRAKHPIMDISKFGDLEKIKQNWEVIRDEAKQLQEKGYFDAINKPGSAAHYDVGFRTFYKYGWRKFYLKWYGYTHTSAQNLCPKTTEILAGIKSVNGAMFSILPPGSQLTRHLDPVACSLRYHLGLMTPNSDNCFISVDEQTYSWRDGEALLFDETYIHFVRNDTDEYRLILMCDVERPMNFLGKIVNVCYKILMRGSVVPNTEEDKGGLANRTFRKLVPLLAKGKDLKQTNKRLYTLVKHTINTLLVLIILAVIASIFKFIGWIFF